IGAAFNVVLCENDIAVAEVGWPSFRAERGFPPRSTTVTVQSVVASSAPIYSAGDRADGRADMIAHFLEGFVGPYVFSGINNGRWHPLLVMTPAVAAVFARDGWSKDDLRAYLGEHLRIEAHWLERGAIAAGKTDFDLRSMVDAGTAPPVYAESDDP